MFVQYMFWEKVQPLDEEAFDPLAHEYPLMVNWSEDEAMKRDAYDTAYGRGNGTVSYYSYVTISYCMHLCYYLYVEKFILILPVTD